MFRPDGSIIPSIQKGVRKAWRPIEDGTTEWWRSFRRFIKEPPIPGEAWIEPERVRAGRRTYLTLTYRVGKGGISSYGHIAIECPIKNLGVWSPTITLRARSAYINAVCSNPKPFLDITYSAGIIDILIKGYPLNEGDIVKILIGDKRGNPPQMPLESQKYPFYIAIDRNNTGIYRLIEKYPVLEVIGDYAVSFDVIAKAIQKPMEKFDVAVIAVDKHNRNPDPNYRGTIKIIPSDSRIKNMTYSFAKKDKGILLIPMSLPSHGTFYFTVVDEDRGISGLSNPISTDFYDEGLKVYFGDIHGHNEFCDGRGSIDEYYQWARDVRRLDFAALTNHVEGAKRFEVPDFWSIVESKAEEYNKPGEFVTFLAFEWGSWSLFGDKCVYYLTNKAPYFPANEEETNTPTKLWRKLRSLGIDVLTIAHHPKYGGKTDWSYMDNELQPLVEIYSIWGDSEKYGEHSVQAALAIGHKLGFIASSDNHIGQPGNPGNGLAAVIAKDLTRESIFYALKERRCYATTGTRILLNFKINNHIMGQEIKLSSKKKSRRIYIHVAGTAPIEELFIIRNNEEIKVYENLEKTIEINFKDSEPLDKSTYYYIRLIQEDGEKAWSSPIWLNVT